MAKSPKKDDPTKDPEFQNVVQHFLRTPPKPHKPHKPKDGEEPSRQKD